jgi:hypothetical protein
MKFVKVGVWLLGAIALFLLARHEGVGNGSSYIQFADGAILVYGAGEYIEKRPRIKRFIEHHHAMKRQLEELHAKHDELHSKHTALIHTLQRFIEGGSE